MKEQDPKTKQTFQRELINEHLPYELLAFCTVRYYGELQAAGELDIIDLIMFVEGLDRARSAREVFADIEADEHAAF